MNRDEVAVTAIRDRLAALKELDKRREAILASLEERGLLTPELRAKVETADLVPRIISGRLQQFMQTAASVNVPDRKFSMKPTRAMQTEALHG